MVEIDQVIKKKLNNPQAIHCLGTHEMINLNVINWEPKQSPDLRALAEGSGWPRKTAVSPGELVIRYDNSWMECDKPNGANLEQGQGLWKGLLGWCQQNARGVPLCWHMLLQRSARGFSGAAKHQCLKSSTKTYVTGSRQIIAIWTGMSLGTNLHVSVTERERETHTQRTTF